MGIPVRYLRICVHRTVGLLKKNSFECNWFVDKSIRWAEKTQLANLPTCGSEVIKVDNFGFIKKKFKNGCAMNLLTYLKKTMHHKCQPVEIIVKQNLDFRKKYLR